MAGQSQELVAELDGQADRSEAVQGVGEEAARGVVAVEGLRKLQQHARELARLAQRPEVFDELVADRQVALVRDFPVGLDPEFEGPRAAAGQRIQRAGKGHRIEGEVQLDRGEVPGVIVEHACAFGAGGVERPDPIGEAVAAGAHDEFRRLDHAGKL